MKAMTCDSRGSKSRTLVFVAISFIATTAKYIVGGMDLPLVGVQPYINPNDYGLAVAFILGIWLGREAIDTKRGNGSNGNPPASGK